MNDFICLFTWIHQKAAFAFFIPCQIAICPHLTYHNCLYSHHVTCPFFLNGLPICQLTLHKTWNLRSGIKGRKQPGWQDEKEAVGSQTSCFQRKYARHKGDAILPSATQPNQQRRRRTGNAGHPCNGDRGQNRITESRDGKDHAECDEDHGFFTNGLHGTKHTGIQAY